MPANPCLTLSSPTSRATTHLACVTLPSSPRPTRTLLACHALTIHCPSVQNSPYRCTHSMPASTLPPLLYTPSFPHLHFRAFPCLAFPCQSSPFHSTPAKLCHAIPHQSLPCLPMPCLPCLHNPHRAATLHTPCLK